MKKLLSLLLILLLLSSCATTYDGPTEDVLRLREHTVTHYSSFDDFSYTNRTVYAYDLNGNRVRSMTYQDGELATVSNMRYDDRGNCIREVTWDHSGWLPRFDSRVEQTYDDQNRLLRTVSYNFWGIAISSNCNTYDDEAHTSTYENDYGDHVLYYYDENGSVLRDVAQTAAGTYETVYEYDENGNRTGWLSYQDGQLFDHYEARYDDQNRQIWGGRYDAAGNLQSHTEYTYDDEKNTMTYTKNHGGKRVEHYHADGRPHMIEDFDQDGSLSMLQQYYYQDIRVPRKEE